MLTFEVPLFLSFQSSIVLLEQKLTISYHFLSVINILQYYFFIVSLFINPVTVSWNFILNSSQSGNRIDSGEFKSRSIMLLFILSLFIDPVTRCWNFILNFTQSGNRTHSGEFKSRCIKLFNGLNFNFNYNLVTGEELILEIL